MSLGHNELNWGRVMHICVNELTIIGSDNGLLPGCVKPLSDTDGLLLIGNLGTNFSEILNEIYIFVQDNGFENVVCKMLAILSQPLCVNIKQITPMGCVIYNNDFWQLCIILILNTGCSYPLVHNGLMMIWWLWMRILIDLTLMRYQWLLLLTWFNFNPSM